MNLATATMEGARASFLDKAAHLTCSRSPSTSAHLISERQALTRSLQNGARSASAQACQRCGTIATSVWKPKRATTKSTKKSPGLKPLPKLIVRAVMRRCDACGKVAKLSVDPKAAPSRSLKVRRSLPTLAGPELRSSPTSDALPREEPKLSSKKRAKAKKDREGLQAMLNKKRPSYMTQQMNLLDFMRP